MPASDAWSRRGLLGLGAGLAGLALPRSSRAAVPSRDELGGWLGGPGTFTLSNATLQLPDGQVIEGAGVAVEDGLLVEVGSSVKGGEDLGGAWICPGLVDAGSSLGLIEVSLEPGSRDDDEGSGAVTPDARVTDAYNPRSELIPVARTGGLTHAVIVPSGGRLVPGQAALMRLSGLTVQEATVQAPAGLCVSLGKAGTGGEGGPKSRMGVAMRLRELLEKAGDPPTEDEGKRRKKKGKGGGKDGGKDDDKTPSDAVWKSVRARELRLLVSADRADDLLTAIALRHAYDLDMVLVGAAESWMVATELAQAQVPVLLGPVDTQPGSFEHMHARYDTAAQLHAAGVPFAFRTASAHNARLLPTLAGLTVAHGLPRGAAVHAMTAAAGEILSVPGIGRLDVGVPASFFVVAGDPIQPRFPVLRTWIDGRPVTLETRQTRLYEAFRELP